MSIKLFFLFVFEEFAKSSNDINTLEEDVLDDMVEIVEDEDREAEGNEHDEASLPYLCQTFDHYCFLLFVE